MSDLRAIHAVFTSHEVMLLRDALSEEVVRMRMHVQQLDVQVQNGTKHQEDTIGARRRLYELEALLTWAKEAAARC